MNATTEAIYEKFPRIYNISQMQLQRFKDKVCLITASATGIGLAIAERLAKEGAIVLVNSRKESNVNPAVDKINKAGGRAVAAVGNIVDKSARENIIKMIEKNYGRLDVLVLNHATSLHYGSTLETTESAMDKIYTAYQPSMTIGVYGILKSALLGMVKLLAKEFQYDGIRVNGVAPGLIKTKFSEPMWKDEKVGAIAKQEMKIDRFGEPEEIAGVVSFLASKDASYVTGETIIPMGTASARL